MIPEIRKILYATDLSENARYAFGYALALARRFDAEITVLHVLEELSPTALLIVGDIIGEKRWSSLKDEKEHQVIEELQKRLEDFCNSFAEEEPECPRLIAETAVTTGHPVDRILDYAEKTAADVIVMGSRGQGMLAEVVIGSTSRRVLRRGKIPVMVVQPPEPA
jgi:nucleotide-binding universal stress UspA family protein